MKQRNRGMAGDALRASTNYPAAAQTVPGAAVRAAKSAAATAGRKLLRARRIFSALGKRQPANAVYVGNNRLLVGTMIGGRKYAFYVEADDRLLIPWFALTGSYEADVTAFLLRNLGRDAHCIDVGANFGYFACLMARVSGSGRVLAVEPDAELAGLVQDNFCLNGVHERARIIRGAVADRPRDLTLYRREFRSGNTSMIAVGEDFTDYFNEPSAQPFNVQAQSIDRLADLLSGRVDVMKVDVEGAEPLVLAGAARTIERNPHILILMEWSPGQIAAAGHSIPDFIRQIGDLGLQCSLLEKNRETALTASALETLPYQSALVLRGAARRKHLA